MCYSVSFLTWFVVFRVRCLLRRDIRPIGLRQAHIPSARPAHPEARKRSQLARHPSTSALLAHRDCQ